MKPDVSLRTIFNGALEREDPAGRDHYLEAACGGDRALRKRLESLLAAHHGAGGFLPESSDPPSAAPTTVLPAGEKPGERIGRYKLLEQIGEGGCGVVYMAEQEEPVRRRVALKVIKLGMDTRQVIARFEAERQALAMMDHPNIARVLDAGATDSGRPFFVMELVRGVRITEFCDARKLSARERLALFLPVCHAVQHAHQKGIIHRDLKPSNILVTMIDGTPVPKVIDFGIAKATNNQRLTDLTLFTAFEQFIGTPAYMSPEQAEMSGVDIDTRTDIYSLGVVLYELLTGKTPFDAGEMMKAGLDAIRRTIRETEPPKPSTRLHDLENADLTSTAAARHTEAPRLIHQIRGDLDWIAMKCLAKDRNRRYETATGLALDIQRHLNDEVITARPPSTVYQAGRFLRRRRGLALGAAAVLAAMLVGTVASTWQAVRATRAERAVETELQAKQEALRQAVTSRGEAMEQRERARRAVDDMYTEFSEKLLARTPRMEPVQQAFLEKALDYYEAFAEEDHADPVARRKTAEASRRVGEIREKLGDLPQAEGAYRRSIKLLEAAEQANQPASDADLAALAASLQVLAALQSITSQAAHAEPNVRRALALREKLARAAVPSADATHELARTLNLLAIILSENGALAEALETCQRSLRELDSALPAEASAKEKQAIAFTRISALTNLADLSKDLGQAEEMEQYLREARELAGRLVNEEPGNPSFRLAQRVTYNNSAAFTLARSDFQNAETFFGKAEAIARKLADDFPLVPDHRLAEMSSRANVALVLSLQHRHEEAEGMLRESFAGLEALSAQFPENLDYAAALADEHLNLGTVLKDLGRFSESRRFYEKSLEINQAIVARLPKRAHALEGLSKTWFNLGLLHHAVEEPDQAYAAFGEAIRTIESLPDASDSLDAAGSIAASLVQQSMILRGSRQRPDLSLPLLERAETLLGRCLANNPLSQNSRTTSTTLKRELGDVFLALDRQEEAVAAFEDSIAQCRALVADFPGKVEYKNRLGDSLCGLSHVWEDDPEKTEESIKLVREALALQEVILEPGAGGRTADIARRSLAHHCTTLALLLMDKGLTDDAQAMQQRGYDMQKRIIATDPTRKEPWCALGAGLNNFALRLRDADQPDEAIALLRQAVEAQQEAITIDPTYERSRWFLRNHFMNIAQAQQMLNDLQAAIDSYGEAVRVGEGLVRDRPSAPFHQNNLAVDLKALATLTQDTGRIAESLAHQERMLQLVERLSSSDDENLPDRSVLADLQQVLARLYALGPDPHLRNASRAVELAKDATANEPKHPTAWHALGLAHCMAGTPAEAIAAVEESIKLTGGGDALNWFVRAMARWQLGDQEGARRDQARALAWLKGEGSKPFRKMAEPYEAEATKKLKLRPGVALPHQSRPPSQP